MILATVTGILLTGSGALVPSEQGVSVPLGSTATLPIVVTDSTGAAVNLTGGTLTLTARDQTLAPILSVAAVLTAPLGGQASFYLPSSIWAAVVQGAYQYDVWYIDSAGNQAQVVAPGLFLVTRKVPDVLPGVLTPPPVQAFLGSAIGLPLVFQPGGTAGGNVYTSEPTLVAAAMSLLSSSGGTLLVAVDSTKGPAVFTAPHSWQGRVALIGANGNLLSNELTIADGAIQTYLAYTENLVVFGACVSAPAFAFTGASPRFIARSGSNLIPLGGHPFIDVAANQQLFFFGQPLVGLSNAGGPFFGLPFSTSQLFSQLYGGTNAGIGGRVNFGTGVVGSSWIYDFDASWAANTLTLPNFFGTFLPAFNDVADGVGYIPASVANWNNSAPLSVLTALDRIAAKIGPIP